MRAEQLAMLTDFYQLTMLGGYFASGKLHQKAVFELYFRKLPHAGGYCVAAGLEDALNYLESLQFGSAEIEYLGSLGVFSREFLEYLRAFRFTGDVWAVPEGTVVFPNIPLLRVEAALPQAQVVESTLLNLVNFQTLIASKSARICQAAAGGNVLEFGLRRAQGVDGALSATRAAFIGGCTATSNTLAGQLYQIPVRGTQAHSWVMSFESELEAFRAYARHYPDSATLLVDTYDTLSSGVPNAIVVGLELQRAGHRFSGIRLDSGDLAYLSKQARQMLDEAGLTEARIVASNDLDEFLIESLLQQGARIDTWGVGTKLVTSKGDPALGGVYKLVAIEPIEGGDLEPRIKISANPEKITIPAVKQAWRAVGEQGQFLGDALALVEETPGPGESLSLHDPLFVHVPLKVAGERWTPLLEPVMKAGVRTRPAEPLTRLQQRTLDSLGRLRPEHRRLRNPEQYRVGLTDALYNLRQSMLEGSRTGCEA